MGVARRYVVLALIILIPTFVSFAVPLYNTDSPELIGLPFFYWFQILWLVATAGFYFVFVHLRGKQP
jgi:1-acyl-sn-glycerol-3-phosphate acyltransferase